MVSMTPFNSCCLAALLLLTMPRDANALCIYNGAHFIKNEKDTDFGGRLNAKTTLEGEFQDAALVVRAKVISERAFWVKDNDPDPDAESSIVYRLQVDQVFKGKPAKFLSNYTERNSGGFYLDVGQEYLLFLSPVPSDNRQIKKQAPGGYLVNYPCGKSDKWSKVSEKDKASLNRLGLPGGR